MNKEIIKEFKNDYLGINIFLYIIYAVIGIIIIQSDQIYFFDAENTIYLIFYTLAFFTLLAYFSNRVKDDYELLFLGFIDVLVASFIFTNSYYFDFDSILVDGMLIFSVGNILNKGYRYKQLVEKEDINYVFKLISAILLVFITAFGISVLYKYSTLGLLIYGYYFIAFGLFNLLEPLTALLLKNQLMLNSISEKIRNKKSKKTKNINTSKRTGVRKIKPVENKKPKLSYKEGEVKKSKKERKVLKENVK